MAIQLFITPQELVTATPLDGNVDVDKYLPFIEQTMDETVQEILGTELYEKILTDLENDSLSGLYLDMFIKFIKPITKFETVADYMSIGGIQVSNIGVVRSTSDNIVIVDKDEIESLSNKYHAKAQTYIVRFNKWICYNTVEEYKTHQDEVNASKTVSLTPNWYI